MDDSQRQRASRLNAISHPFPVYYEHFFPLHSRRVHIAMPSIFCQILNAIRLGLLSSKALVLRSWGNLLRLLSVLRNLRKWRRDIRRCDERDDHGPEPDPLTRRKFIESTPRSSVVVCASRVPMTELVRPTPRATSNIFSPDGYSSRSVSHLSLDIALASLEDAEGGQRLRWTARPASQMGSRRASQMGSRRASQMGSRPPSQMGSRPPSQMGSRPPSPRSPVIFASSPVILAPSYINLRRPSRNGSRSSSLGRSESSSRVPPPDDMRSSISLAHSSAGAGPMTREVADSAPACMSEKAKGKSRAVEPESGPSARAQLARASSIPETSPSLAPGISTTNAANYIGLEDLVLKPIHPSGISRYERNVIIPKRRDEVPTNIEVVERYTDPNELFNIPEGWIACAHPEGALYFHHEDKSLFTEANLCDVTHLSVIDRAIEKIELLTSQNVLERPLNSELVLEILPDEFGVQTCRYYFADNETRSLFWFEAYDAASLTQEVDGEVTKANMKHELESRYWQHCEMFPNHRDVPDALLQELMGILLHGTIDSMTSSSSIFPYSPGEAQQMMKLLKNVERVGSINVYLACAVSRIMGNLEHSKFLHYHGQHRARLERTQSIHGQATLPHPWYFGILSFLLFNAPKTHMEALDVIDHVLEYKRVKMLTETLQEEWKNLSLTTTVMLSVNVSFLAIQSVDSGTNKRCAAQVASYLSTVASVGGIIIGLLLILGHRVPSRGKFDGAGQEYYGPSSYELETLAIMYSLPYALMMWAMVTFLVALSCVCFAINPEMPAQSIGTRVPIGIAWLCILTLVLWFLLTDKEGRDRPGLLRLVELLQNLKAVLSQWCACDDTDFGGIKWTIKRVFSRRRDESPTTV